ncbi:MAG: DUF4403 family protein [Candidatus Eisenbacteria bacterium]|uniref:DUF4403 family protein n=1 Tax=Eiseniibacteriota bacterium TaxID=2212470 RepID=A0A849SEX5_UNCEI|nr:DUF4403 family protein [Candidatus Eisenbacteria bacterium]
MTRSRRKLALIGLVLIGTMAGVWFIVDRSTLILDAPPPQFIRELADTLPPVPKSVVEAPVTYDLDTAIDSLEAAVPKTYGDLERRFETSNNRRVSFAFLLHRSPFRVTVEGHTVFISADVEYSGRVWYKPPLGPEIEVSCGTGGDPPRRATLTLESTAELTREWGIRTQSRIARLEAASDSARDRCRLTFLRLDMTPRVLEITERLISERLGAFDEAVARWPVRRRFEKIWRDLQKPLRLTDSLYMTINPTAAQLGEVGADGKTVFANLRLVATPRVTSGPRPTPAIVSLPPLERADDVGRRAQVLIDGAFTYPFATQHLKRALVGRSIEQAGHRIRIRDVRISGIGGGKVALGVALSGAVRGRLYFSGTPSFDPVTRDITVPDLDYDIGTAQILVKSYEWLADVRLRDFLRERARLPDSVVVQQLSQHAEKGVNRDLPARGTRLSGRIDHAEVIEVRALVADLRIRALANAELKLAIDRAPSIPQPRQPDGKDAAQNEAGELAN